jgi:CubicO group peptidase (beta-lactamase class C family)
VMEFTGDGKRAVMVRHLVTHTTGITEQSIRAHMDSPFLSVIRSGGRSTLVAVS